jgi:group I intron endonuclease
MRLANALECLYESGGRTLAGVAAVLATTSERTTKMVDSSVAERITVYKVTCRVSGKAYIGVTYKTAEQRWKEHVGAALWEKSRRAFMCAIRKYGEWQFFVETIFVAFGRDAGNEMERVFIAEHGTMSPHGYNLSTGGEGTVGRCLSDEARANMSAARTGLKFSEKARASLSALRAGKPWTARKRAGITSVMKTDEYRSKMRAATAHVVHPKLSDDGKAKVSRANKQKWATPGYRERMIAARNASPKVQAFRARWRLRGRLPNPSQMELFDWSDQ